MASPCTLGEDQAPSKGLLMLLRRVSCIGSCVRIFCEQVTCISDRRSEIRSSLPLNVVMTYDDTERPLQD